MIFRGSCKKEILRKKASRASCWHMRYKRFCLTFEILSDKDRTETIVPIHGKMLNSGKISPKIEQIKPMIENQRS